MAARTRLAVLLALASSLALATPVRADQAYDRVAAAFAQAGGQLDPCAFTQAQLEAALKGVPPEVAKYVPDLRHAIRQGIATHRSGGCVGRKPGAPTGNAAQGGALPPPEVSGTPPAATQPTTAQPPTSAITTPATAATGARHRDRTPLAIGLLALAALVALALIVWGLARLRGWDAPWLARTRHAWGEAGYRTSVTWAEFTDWLRLGR